MITEIELAKKLSEIQDSESAIDVIHSGVIAGINIYNENVNIYNPNKKFNNIIDINEVVRFINFALKKRRVKRGIYNFSASNPIKFIHVTKLIKKIFRSKSKIINKKSSKKSFIISNKKILNNLNFKTSTTKKIISRCCNNILDKNYN